MLAKLAKGRLEIRIQPSWCQQLGSVKLSYTALWTKTVTGYCVIQFILEVIGHAQEGVWGSNENSKNREKCKVEKPSGLNYQEEGQDVKLIRHHSMIVNVVQKVPEECENIRHVENSFFFLSICFGNSLCWTDIALQIRKKKETDWRRKERCFKVTGKQKQNKTKNSGTRDTKANNP